MKKPITLIEKYNAIQAIGSRVEVPYHVWACFGSEKRDLVVLEDQVCLGEDFVSIEGAQSAIEFFVNQLGGKVTWPKNEKT